MTTTIEWTETVWNPTTGCDRISRGCDNCYALTMAKRLKGMGQAKYQTDGNPATSGPGFGVAVHPDVLTAPLRWRTGRRVFVNSMSDLFHARVPREFVAQVFAVMAATPQHTYQILTKRPERMARMLGELCPCGVGHTLMEHRLGQVLPLPNVWLGTSVEDQKTADLRIPALLDTPAAVRWLSMEPLLGPVRLSAAWIDMPADTRPVTARDLLGIGLPNRVDWVVVGGESGPKARPMQPDWARSLRDQCTSSGVPFFFKQWGEFAPMHPRVATGKEIRAYPGALLRKAGKKLAGRELDGRTWDQYPTQAEAVTQ